MLVYSAVWFVGLLCVVFLSLVLDCHEVNKPIMEYAPTMMLFVIRGTKQQNKI